MSNELIISIVVNGIISISSIVGNIIIAIISKPKDLSDERRYNKFIPKIVIQQWSEDKILKSINEYPYSYLSYSRKTRRYIETRYKQIIKRNNKKQGEN